MEQIPMQLPNYLKQQDNPQNQSRKEVLKNAVDYFWQLIKEDNNEEKAREMVAQKTGVIL